MEKIRIQNRQAVLEHMAITDPYFSRRETTDFLQIIKKWVCRYCTLACRTQQERQQLLLVRGLKCPLDGVLQNRCVDNTMNDKTHLSPSADIELNNSLMPDYS